MSSPITVMVVDDEKDIVETFRIIFKKRYNIVGVNSGQEALNKIQKENIDIVLLDIKMPRMDGIETLRRIKKMDESLPVIMVSALKDVSFAVEAMKLSAYDYVLKPFDMEEISVLISKALEKRNLIKENISLKAILKESTHFENIIGKSKEMAKIFNLIEKVSKSDSSVLISGESGTGKELVARAIHKRGKRFDKPFITVNCASIPENLLESELFGHEAGSFTGASERRLGKFEVAHNGTIFLDEIGCMPFSMQAKLLRALQENEIERIGSSKPISINVRIISATNLSLEQAIKEGKFREDLFYRLNVIPIHLPPLRERLTDIPLLVDHFLEKYCREMGKNKIAVSDEVKKVFSAYTWPGNVRELANLIERIVTLADHPIISVADLPIGLISNQYLQSEKSNNLKEVCQEFERQYIKRILEESNYNQSQAARKLAIHRTTLISKMESLGLKPNKF